MQVVGKEADEAVQPGESQVYEFRATQYGTSWYHSHFSLQCEFLPQSLPSGLRACSHANQIATGCTVGQPLSVQKRHSDVSQDRWLSTVHLVAVGTWILARGPSPTGIMRMRSP